MNILVSVLIQEEAMSNRPKIPSLRICVLSSLVSRWQHSFPPVYRVPKLVLSMDHHLPFLIWFFSGLWGGVLWKCNWY